MRAIYNSLVILVVLALAMSPSQAQFKKLGQKIKQAADLVGADQLVKKEIDKKDTRNDSIMFNYAISLSDNSTLFETRDFLQKNNQLISDFLIESEKQSAKEEAETFINYGENFYSAQKFRSAEISFFTAKYIFEDAGDTINLDYFRTLSNLGLLYHSMGRYNLAEEYTYMTLDRMKNHMGENSGGYAASLNNLAVLNNDRGRYNEAEVQFNQAIEINENSLGNESLGQAIMVNNQAMLYQKVGRYAEAEQLLKKSLSIASESIGESSGRYQKLMVNLALLLQDMGKQEEAEEIYLNAINLKEKRFGKSHPDYAYMLMSLASLYVEMDKLDEVEKLLNESKEIFEKKLGKESLEYASALGNLGKYYQYIGDHEKALANLKEARSIRMDLLGDTHPLYAETLEDLAVSYWKTGDIGMASELFTESLNEAINFIQTYFPPMSEQEKTLYWDKLYPSFQKFYAFAGANFTEKPDLLKYAFNYRLSTKALLLSSTSKIRSRILNGTDEALKKDYLSWIDHKEMLSRYYTFSKDDLREEKINLDSLEGVTNNLERSLSQRSNLFSSGYKLNEVSFENVQSSLGAGEGIVEMIQYFDFDRSYTDEAKYLALVVSAQTTSAPRGILLENGTQLETRYLKYYQNAIRQRIEDEFSFVQFWESIDEALQGLSKVYLSLDGVYNQISIGTLRKPDGSYVVEDLNVVIIGNAKEVIDIKQQEKQLTKISPESHVYIVGFPDYGNDQKLAPLPGTKTEVDKINAILKKKMVKPVVLLQESATEEKVKGIGNPDILHIATHGFFLEDVNNLSTEKVFGIQTEKAKDNPLLRSGLFLTGAGNLMDVQSASELTSDDNGILTAYEAMNLPLDNTDIVILSACETGLGDIKSGEGVYGLQRAFLVAGSKAMIMSLWKVNDDATQQLMTIFYENWLASGNKTQAFKQAQLAIKEKYRDPYFWGAFVLIGA